MSTCVDHAGNRMYIKDGKIEIEAKSRITLGAGGSHPVPLGDLLMQLFNAHIYNTGVGPSSVPTTPMTEQQLSKLSYTRQGDAMIATSQLEQDLYRSVTNVQFADYGSAARASQVLALAHEVVHASDPFPATDGEQLTRRLAHAFRVPVSLSQLSYQHTVVHLRTRKGRAIEFTPVEFLAYPTVHIPDTALALPPKHFESFLEVHGKIPFKDCRIVKIPL